MSDPNEKIVAPEPAQVIDSDELMSKYDKESAYRRLTGIPFKLVFIIAVGWSVFQLYTALFGTFPSTLQRAPHLGAALVMTFLLYPGFGKPTSKIPIYDYILAALAIVCTSYHIFFYDALQLRSGLFTQLDIAISIIAVLLVLEAARRVAGLVIVSLASFFLIYALFGKYFPGFMHHPGLRLHRVATMEWMGTEGILGSPIYVSSTFIFLFLVFATFLKASGVGDWMTNIAMSLCGRQVGGPAKAAVVASALQGTISGSSVANTVSTGSITIPLMKKTGYKPEFAGAVEAAASTGGQIMPPIMGAAAFIMTEYIGTSYSTIALAACIPALLYFTGIFTNVHFEALKLGLTGVAESEIQPIRGLLKRGWYMITPVIVIVYMLVAGRTAMRAALFGIIACILIWCIEIVRETHGFDFKGFIVKFIIGLEQSARGAVAVAITCGCAGIIVGVITKTGLGLKMAGGIVALAGGSKILTMIFTMICSILLGMGVPTTANYIIQATISAPALVALGVPAIAAHLFVFYFGIVADITPPVALAAFAGSGIAGSDPMKTGFNAVRLGMAAYIVPYMFVFNPIMVLVRPEGMETGMFIFRIGLSIVTAIVGMIGIASGMTGYLKVPCNIVERLLLVAGGLLLVDPGGVTDMIGVACLLAAYMLQLGRIKKKNAAAA